MYEELLSKSATSSVNAKRLIALCSELYETINQLNPNFMRDLLKLQLTDRPAHEKYRMIISEFNLDIVLNFKIFIVTFVISVDFYMGLLYRGERIRRGDVGLG